jgi:hypothetical protein
MLAAADLYPLVVDWLRAVFAVAPPPGAAQNALAHLVTAVLLSQLWEPRSRSRAQATRSYTWCSPPSTGLARIEPVVERTTGTGVSSPRARCGRASL